MVFALYLVFDIAMIGYEFLFDFYGLFLYLVFWVILWCYFLMINIGPAHPSTHGVLRIISCFNAEVIEYTYTEIGLLHRGSEKLIESLATFYTTMHF